MSDHSNDTPAVIPFAVLEAVRAADAMTIAPEYGESEETHAVRLGRSPMVLAQVERYQTLAQKGVLVDPHEVGGLFRLIGRRRDADLVMAEAGRRAGEHVAEWHVSRFWRTLLRMVPTRLKRRLGESLVRRTARTVLDVDLSDDLTARWHDRGSLNAQSGHAKPCEVFRAATAELLRRLTPFDGALFHVECRKNGDDRCVWSAQHED